MYVPFLVLLPILWGGVISGGTLMTAGHVLMVPCMIAAMLRRGDEYTQSHRQHRHAGTADHTGTDHEVAPHCPGRRGRAGGTRAWGGGPGVR